MIRQCAEDDSMMRKLHKTGSGKKPVHGRIRGIAPDTTIRLSESGRSRAVGGDSPVTGDATLAGAPGDRRTPGFNQDWQPGMQIQQEFVIERLLGSGGMGHVYLVRRISDSQLYAMKTIHAAKLTRAEQRHMFFREIRTWIDLPEHPNLVKCRFVRMLKNRPLVFSDYINGGTLMDRIERDSFTGIGSILDIAIGSAWGLQAAHHAGVIHQDIKPANILLTADGTPKITDFGIARALGSRMTGASDGRTAAGGTHASLMVSSDGMTIAYCSPEQARHKPLDYRTDIWSWGIAILQIFTGDLPWVCGAFIRSILEQVIRTPPESARHRLPAELAGILDRCFQENPADRWPGFSEISAALKGVYRALTGRDFGLKQPDPPEIKAHPGDNHRMSSYGGEWKNPAEWLERVTQLTGKAAPVSPLPGDSHGASITSRNLTDIEILESAEKIYRHLIATGQSDLIDEYAELKNELATSFESIGDYKSAVDLYDSIIPLRRKIAAIEPCPKSNYYLARTSLYKGAAQYAQNLFNDAAASFSEAIRGFTTILPSAYGDTYRRLVYAYMNRGSAFNQLNASSKALRDYQSALDVFRRFGDRATARVSQEAALIRLNLASLLNDEGRTTEASCLLRKACVAFRYLHRKKKILQFQGFLATALTQFADCQSNLGCYSQAQSSNREALALLEDLIDIKGFQGYEYMIVLALHNRSRIALSLGQPVEALTHNDVMIERVRREMLDGHTDIESFLPFGYGIRSDILLRLERIPESLEANQSALQLFQRMISRDDHSEMTPELCKMMLTRARILRRSNRRDEARDIALEVIRMMKMHAEDSFGAKCRRVTGEAERFLSTETAASSES